MSGRAAIRALWHPVMAQAGCALADAHVSFGGGGGTVPRDRPSRRIPAMTMTVLPHREELGIKDGRMFIDGEWVEGSEGGSWTHIHPATNEEAGVFTVASADDVSRAVGAARRAFDDGDWTSWQARDRKRLLQRISNLVHERTEEINNVQTYDNGIPVGFSSIYQISAELAGDIFDYYAGWADRIHGETIPQYTGGDMFTMTLREPVGVVGAIIPWNAPVMLFAQKIAPALAAGCTVVLKPSEYASFAAIRLMEILEEAGVPKGVVSLVLGEGHVVGEALITDPRVDKLTFTGSRTIGKRIQAAAAERIARVSLELGGKSPSIVFPDCDLDMAAMTAMGQVTMGLSGQGCVCHTRALVHESIYDDFIEKADAMTLACTLGDPFDPATTSSPLINTKQLDRVLGLIERGREEGARLVRGGERANGGLEQGNFVTPTLFADVDNSMTIAQEEIFGPVLSVIPFKEEDEAIRLANDSDYGLGATIWTSDVKRSLRFAKVIR